MKSVSSRIWTRVAVFISYDDNHYTTGTKQSDGKIPLMLELWGMRNTPSLQSFPGPLLFIDASHQRTNMAQGRF